MATNEILQFAGTDTGTNLLSQAEYLADAQRPIGNQPGVARSKLVNKAFRQSSLIAAAVAQFVADNQANNITDALTPRNIADYLQAAITGALGVTPPQFDNDTSLATTAFVQRALGNVRSIVGKTANYQIQIGDAGSVFAAAAPGITFTLPALNLGPSGTSFSFHCNSTAGSVIIACSGADAIQYAGKALSSITLKSGDALTLVTDGGTSWTPVAQSAGAGKQSFAAVRTTTTQAIASGITTKVQCNGEDFDPYGVYDNASNFRFQPTIPGKYLLVGNVQMSSPTAITGTPAMYSVIYKNGSFYRLGNLMRFSSGGSAYLGSSFNMIVDANGSTDYFELYAVHDTGLGDVVISAGGETHFSGARIA